MKKWKPKKAQEGIKFTPINIGDYRYDQQGNIVNNKTGEVGTLAIPEVEVSTEKPSIISKILNKIANNIIGAAVAENPAVATASGWKIDSNGNWIQSPDSGSRELSRDLSVLSTLSPTNYGTAAGDVLLSKVGFPLYQIIKNKQVIPYIKSYLNHPTWQTYYHGSPSSFNLREAWMGTQYDMGLHSTKNFDVAEKFKDNNGVILKFRAPRPKATTSDLMSNGVNHLRTNYTIFKSSGNSYNTHDFNILDTDLLNELNQSNFKYTLKEVPGFNQPFYRQLEGKRGIDQEFNINPRARILKSVKKSKRSQFNREADELVSRRDNINSISSAVSEIAEINKASANLLDKYGITTVKYYNRNPMEGNLPSYWINNQNKIDPLFTFKPAEIVTGISTPISSKIADE